MTEIERRLDALKRAVDELYDDRVRQRRMLADLLYNLDEENMPVVKDLIEHYRTENTSAIAALTLRADENGAAIDSLAAVLTDQSESIASISQQADENSASIESVAAVQTAQAETIASISQQADANSAQVYIAVERAAAAESAADSANENVSNGAYIMATVNEDGSGVRILAEKLELDGYATFSNLENAGETVINGANIKTGTLYADAIEVSPNNSSGITLDKQTLFPNGIYFGDDVASWHVLESYVKAVTENGVKVLKIRASQELALSAGSGSVAGISMYKGNIGGSSVFFCSPSGGSHAGYWTYNGSEIATKADLAALKAELSSGSGSGTSDPCANGHTQVYIPDGTNCAHSVECSVCGKVLVATEYCTDDGSGCCERCGEIIV